MSEVRLRDPRVECPAFLAFVRRHACCACGAPAPSQAAHLRMGNLEIGKRPTGIAEKPSDRWATPLCQSCHLDAPDAQHNIGEPAFWRRVGIDPFNLATNLYAQFERRRNRSAGQRDAVVARAVRMKRRRAKKAAHRETHKSILKKVKRPQRSATTSDSRSKLRGPKRKWPSRPFPAGRGFNGGKNG